MIKFVDFISRAKAETLEDQDNLAIISVSEPKVDPALLALPESRILRLSFHDIDPGNEDVSFWKLFDEEQARSIIDFVDQLHAASRQFELMVHCRAGISRSAAIALYVANATGCRFPRRPFAGLANRHLLRILSQQAGIEVTAPRALPRQEHFSVSVSRNFSTGMAQVTVTNTRNNEQFTLEGPMLDVPELAAAGMQRVWGVEHPPASYHVTNWDALE